MAGFDEKAIEYDAWYETPIGALVDRLETDCAFRLFEAQPNMHVLDAGCGTGNFSQKLAEKGAVVTGIDISEPMLQYAKEKADTTGLPMTFQAMDLYHLDFPDNTFDAVLTMAAFEFIARPEEALAEFFRVTRPGGQVLVGTITANSSWGQAYLRQADRPDSVFFNSAFKTTDEMRALLPQYQTGDEECVFFPPDIDAAALEADPENRWRGQATGAFICVAWQKPAHA